MNAVNVAFDVVREAFASKLILGLFAFIAVGLVVLTFALDLEVVDGALAASRLFGVASKSAIVPIDVALRPVFQALSWTVFYLGILFGIVASADIASRMLEPGRVEFTLALPVRRAELVVGTYLGVALICALSTSFAVGGVSLVLFWKAHFFTPAPLIGACCAFMGFLAVYAVMLLLTTLWRSTPMAAGSGIAFYVACLLTSDRKEFVSWFRSRELRSALELAVSPLPRLRALADLGAGLSGDGQLAWTFALPLVASTLAFAAFAVAIACFVVSEKDY